MRYPLVFLAVIAASLSSYAHGALILSDMATFEQGTMPIVIVASHGGALAIPDVDVRDCTIYECDRDLRTRPLAIRVADNIEAETGLRPYLVLADFDRDYLDANRPSGVEAFALSTAATAVQVYDYYHAGIRTFVDEIRSVYGEGLLIDVHGQSSVPDTIIRGTDNGDSVLNLSPEAITGPTSILGQMSAVVDDLGAPVYMIEPDPSIPYEDQVEEAFSGGFIIGEYGTAQPDGIDAMQIEFGIDYRVTDDDPLIWQQTASDAADGIVQFHQMHLVPEPSSLISMLAGLTMLGFWYRA